MAQETSDVFDDAIDAPRRASGLARLHDVGRFMWSGMGDALFPPVCLACKQRLAAHDALCAACWRDIRFIRAPLCDRLGIPLGFATGPKTVSAAALAAPPLYDRARAVAAFDGPMRRLIHDFKFHDQHIARRLFGRWLMAAGQEVLCDTDIIVPVPLAHSRLVWRRFNQAELLAREVSRLSGIPRDSFALVKMRRTARQVGLKRLQRQKNVAGTFAVPEWAVPRISGKAIVLIDDVITTGATAGACARVLKTAGAARVDVLVLGLVTDNI